MGACHLLPSLVFHHKIPLSEKPLESGGKRPHCDLFAHLRITVHDHLPVRQDPRPLLFCKLSPPLADVFRLERTAVLKIIDDPRQSHRSVMIDLAVSDSSLYCIIHAACSLSVFSVFLPFSYFYSSSFSSATKECSIVITNSYRPSFCFIVSQKRAFTSFFFSSSYSRGTTMSKIRLIRSFPCTTRKS